MAIRLPIVSSFDPKGVNKAKSAFGKFGGAVAGIAASAVAAVGSIGTAAARMAADLETSFAKIEGLVGVSAAEVAKLEEAAIRLGPAYGKSAQEAADALFFITSAGLRGADATDVLEASLKASAAGLGDVNAIANAATAAMNTYGTEVLTGTDAVDALTEAVRLGQFAPEELSSALGKVIPIANELGVSFEETTGLVAGLTRGGLSASEAVTGIRGAMQAVLKPTGESAAMLEQYGFSAEDVKDSIEKDGLLNTFGMLRDAFGENEEDFTRLIGSQEGLNAVLAMTGEASEEYISIVEQMTDDVGALDDAFSKVEETAGFKFERAMETARAALLPVGETMLEIGASLLDGLMPVIDMLAPVLQEMFSHLEEPLMELVGLLPGLMEAFLPLLPIIGELAGFIADLAVSTMPIFVGLLNLLMPVLELLMPILGTVVGLFELLLIPIETLLMFLTPLVETILWPITEAFGLLSEAVGFLGDTLAPINDEIMPAFLAHMGEYFEPVIEAAKEGLRNLAEQGFQHLIDSGILPVGFSLDDLALDTPQKMAGFANAVIGAFNRVIDAANLVIKAIANVINAVIRGGKKIGRFKGVSELDVESLMLPEIPEMNVSDFISEFTPVDVSGISGRLDRGAGALEGERRASQGMGPLQARATETQGFRSIGIPQLAEGGIVGGPILSLIGEAGPEAVIPLDKLDKMNGNNYTIHVHTGVGDPVRIGEEVVTAIKRYERVSGPVFASA